MTAERWLRISIPIQGFLVLWQVVTALLVDHIPDAVFKVIHPLGGLLLVLLLVAHVVINWDWVRKAYRRT